ncbi:tRNA uridine-5-carboxymethylaminomethyl(34) synthesis GTPase MnmE [Crocinitomix catalasitica]|uniref:tRNA uridine-5-carboxymethylaminomethyl(34) synthesis GTPase MnmE n=1 Tax=Crocinitomix catalasitica TaxID=184607 RepID=UPI000480EFF3|nr:tRNA uridine-5-carboxymethylaminomethyl(34) synthesis GTPase MnmE [Crocinitomix catalasitica]
MNFQNQDDTICALSTAAGMGAIALIRLTGDAAFAITEKVFTKKITDKTSHTAHFGKIMDGKDIIDEVLVTVFKNPASFTGEDSVEIACHGSIYIQEKILALLLDNGARLAGPGEFSLRAFLNGKMDLSQTEAIADLISANSKAAHQVAMHQMRGGFSEEINVLRQELLNFASLVELELDFSEEDVEFADRQQLVDLVNKVAAKTNSLLDSFSLGNVIKNGIPVAIVGSPNAGKSTLLNVLLNEDKAIVSEIAGTTRDVIEDTIVLNGVEFRFFDTAGIRITDDKIENLGIERAYQQIRKARIVLLLIDLKEANAKDILKGLETFRDKTISEEQIFIPVFNKIDTVDLKEYALLKEEGLFISAKHKTNLPDLIARLTETVADFGEENQTIITNVRHFEILKKCKLSLIKVEEGLELQIPGDLLAMDIRESLRLLGEITGEITSDDLLGNIFANFCIGK